MKVGSKIANCCYCIATAACFIIYGIIATNYDGNFMYNAILFLAWAILLIGYIPWTIVASISELKRTKQNGALVVAVAYTIFLLLLFFGELSKYLNYVEVIRRSS